MTDDAKDSGEEESVNLWKDALERASSKREERTCHLVVCGAPESGKSSLVNLFHSVSLPGKKDRDSVKKGNPLLLEYSYAPLGDQGADEPPGKMHIWQACDMKQVESLATVLPKNELDKIVYLIALDLSRPHLVTQELEYWSKFVQESYAKLIAGLSPEEVQALRDRITRHVQFYQDPKESPRASVVAASGAAAKAAAAAAAEEKETPLDLALTETDVELQRDKPKINVGAPVLFVGTKADMFGKVASLTEADANDKYDLMMAFIRQTALSFGGTTFAIAKAQKQFAPIIRDYIEYRLFNSTFNLEPTVTVTYSNLAEEFLFVPAGFDSIELVRLVLKENTPKFEELFPPPKEKSKRGGRRGGTTAYKMVAEQEDQRFLRTLSFTIMTAKKEPGGSRPRGVARKPLGSQNGLPPGVTNSRPGPLDPSDPRGGKQKQMVGDFFKKLLASSGTAPNSTSRSSKSRRNLP